MVRRAEPATAPDPAARNRMRAKLLEQLAQSPEPEPRPSPVPRKRSAAASRPTQPTPATRPAGRSRVTSTRGRVTIALGAAFCLVLLLSGMTLLLSRHALPGDPLYGVRRAGESASLGLTSGDDAKGRKHLEFAADRVGDIESLAAKYPDKADSPVGDYLTAFSDFDADARAATIDLTNYATDHGDDVLGELTTWAQQQAARITVVEPKLPQAASTKAAAAVVLLNRIVRRAAALAARNTCYTITSGATDDLGVLPATGRCDQPPGAPTPPSPAVGGTAATRTPDKVPATNNPNEGANPGSGAPVAPPATETFPEAPVLTLPPGAVPSHLLPPASGGTSPGTITVPLPLPGVTVPPLLPGLPGIQVGQ